MIGRAIAYAVGRYYSDQTHADVIEHLREVSRAEGCAAPRKPVSAQICSNPSDPTDAHRACGLRGPEGR